MFKFLKKLKLSGEENRTYHNDFRIAGVTFKNDDGSDRQKIIQSLKDNDLIQLNVYSYKGKEAIGVYTMDNKQIGNIKDGDIPYVLDRMKTMTKSIIFDIHPFYNDNHEKIYTAKVIIYYTK